MTYLSGVTLASDRFVFEADSGNDVIFDFSLSYEPDMIEIRQAGITFADLQIETNRGDALAHVERRGVRALR